MSTSLTTGLAINTATFSGAAAAGTISIPGLLAGDIVIASYFGNRYAAPKSVFEMVVSNDGELVQTEDADFSALQCRIVFLRP